jgi:hypothetical protein
MKILELFAGSRCFTRAAEELGHRTFSTDILELEGIDYVVDIFDFDVLEVPFIPDLIWASPDCAAWSRAAGKCHFDGHGISRPVSQKAIQAKLMIDKTLGIIQHFLSLNPNLKFYIENPVGKLQYYLPIQPSDIFRTSIVKRVVNIDQCQYGREFMKPTQIWTNDLRWKPRPKCKGRHRGCGHLENIKNVGDKYDRVKTKYSSRLPGTTKKSKHSSSLGALEKGGYYNRAMIPSDLCLEVINSCKNQISYDVEKIQ